MDLDIEYYADIFSKLCGIPARTYENGVRKSFYSQNEFPKDPALLIEKKLMECKSSIGYIYDEDFFYYGYVNHENTMLLLGPARHIKPDEALISKEILLLGLGKEEANTYRNSMGSLIPIPLESLIQALCSFNYAINHEKKSLKDILIDDSVADKLQEMVKKETIADNADSFEVSEHNTYDIECDLLRIVEHGETDELKLWLNNAPAIRGGVLSEDALRQIKNTFITSATLESRAAIRGGMDVNEALSLSDLYIQKMEHMNLYTDISALQLSMVTDYTDRVARIRGKSNASSFLLSVNKYVYSHISEAIKSKNICDALFISKSVLFDKIKRETGKTFSEYILNIKINESKGLLKYSDHSISSISLYLGFSSQSHYNRTFREITGLTPKKYREAHKK